MRVGGLERYSMGVAGRVEAVVVGVVAEYSSCSSCSSSSSSKVSDMALERGEEA